jgi:general secretion pathway protein A
MYCDYFGFKLEPFTIAPDPAFLYPSAKHRKALAHLKYGLEREGGFILLTGEVGTGKTTLTRLLLEQTPASFRVAYILNAKLDTRDVLASICDELHIKLERERDLSPKSYIDAINANLLETHAQGFKTLVVIEEAQNLGEEVLEMLRLLTNLETNTTKLLHILLVGQPELLELMGRPQLRQLNQRVISRFHLEPLSRSETENYLKHRLRKAGCNRPIFERSAINALHRFSEGVPRKLNLLAERSLLGAYSQDREKVSKPQVVQGNREVFGENKNTKVLTGWMWGSVMALLLLAFGLVFISEDRDVLESQQAFNEESLTPEIDANPDSQAPLIEELAAAQIQNTSDDLIELEPQTLVEETPMEPRVLNAFTGLLSLWRIEAEANDIESLCLAAVENNLRCEEVRTPELTEILEIGRPALIELTARDGASPILSGNYLIAKYQDSAVYLSNEQQDFALTTAEFENQIISSLHYLWKPPLGYTDSVRLNNSNWAVLNWLQPRLEQIDSELPHLITGGRYSQPIAEGVAEFQRLHGLQADGVLGRRTLMKFNEVENLVPLLVTENH